MPVTCAGCANLGHKPAPEKIAELGLGICMYHITNRPQDAGRYVSVIFRRECDKFIPCAPERKAAIEAWLKEKLW